jgi:hypothetical protein
VSSTALAQTDEIQVYDAEIEPQGIFNLMVHSNFTPAGRTVPVFPGAIIADHSFNGTAEWAYGVTPWMEQGLYLPVYTLYSTNHTTTINGFKIRELSVRPHAHDHTFFYGLNYEFSVNAKYWEDRRISYNPAGRLAYSLNDGWAVAVEAYDGFGPLRRFVPSHQQFHEIWAVMDHSSSKFLGLAVEAGIGFGLTPGSDKITLKLMLSRNLNAHAWRP